jgi:uncharacterized protein (DUF1499 family)
MTNCRVQYLKTLTACVAITLLCFVHPVRATDNAPMPEPCPDTPNCVSSLALDAGHRVEPFVITGDPAVALAHLKTALLKEKRISVTKEQGGYLHAEARSLVFRFVDDIELFLDVDSRVIHVRSASRTGHGDFGVNRRRVERIRNHYQMYQNPGNAAN